MIFLLTGQQEPETADKLRQALRVPPDRVQVLPRAPPSGRPGQGREDARVLPPPPHRGGGGGQGGRVRVLQHEPAHERLVGLHCVLVV